MKRDESGSGGLPRTKKGNLSHGKFEKSLTKNAGKVKKRGIHKMMDRNLMANRQTEGRSGNYSTTEKPNWLEYKKQKKERKERRKAKKLTSIYDISVQARQISEKLRRSDCKPQDRKTLISGLHALLKTHYGNVVFTHDMSRIIQWVLKYGDSEIQQDILSELKPSLLLMMQSKYAKNCIKIMLKYGTRQMRKDIKTACYGNILKLVTHNTSAPIIDLIYSSKSTCIEKLYFKQEFYGDIYKGAKDKNIKTLSDVFETATIMKSATLTAVKANLLKILNKNLSKYALIHTILWEYLTMCSVEDKTELINLLRNSIVHLSRTKYGAKVAAICIWHGTNKDRKIIMKSLKEHVKEVCTSEHGYIILLALMDSVDDTVLMNKIILSEMQEHLFEIASNEFGRNVILYLVARRDSHYFHPTLVEYLQQGDNNETSKKPALIRETELRECVKDIFLDAIAENTAKWLSKGCTLLITLAILKIGSGTKLKHVFTSIAIFITNDCNDIKIEEDNVKHDPIEHAGLHMILKKIIQNDSAIVKCQETSFGEVLIHRLNREILTRWIDFNRGCFLLILLLENESELLTNILISKLKPLSQCLISKSSVGASILLKKLK